VSGSRRAAGARGDRPGAPVPRVGTGERGGRVAELFGAAGLDPHEWAPRELRHSFVSLLSANGVRIEDISRLVGHSDTGVTERVYRHQLQAVLDEGTAAMDDIFPLDDAG
jgi:integrase